MAAVPSVLSVHWQLTNLSRRRRAAACPRQTENSERLTLTNFTVETTKPRWQGVMQDDPPKGTKFDGHWGTRVGEQALGGAAGRGASWWA